MTTPTKPANLLAPLLALAETLGSATETTDSGLPVTVAECLDVMHATADELRSLAAHRGEAVAWPSESKPAVDGDGWVAISKRVEHRMSKDHARVWNGCRAACIAAHEAAHPPQAQAGAGDAILAWAVERWHAEVANRPLQNVHRRSLDDVWRQVIRNCGADDVSLCGPRHDELRAEFDRLEGKAISLYNASLGDAHNLHCRAWSELDGQQQNEWRNKAALEASHEPE